MKKTTVLFILFGINIFLIFAVSIGFLFPLLVLFWFLDDAIEHPRRYIWKKDK